MFLHVCEDALMTRSELSNKLKSFRMEHGLTQEQAAPQLGISLRSFIAFELGYKRRPRPLTLAKINMAMDAIDGGKEA